MNAYAGAVPIPNEPGRTGSEGGPTRLHWWIAVLVFEVLFILCRASVHEEFSLDDPLVWLAGLTPFLVAACGERLFDWQPRIYLQTWIATLAAFLAIRAFNLAQFIELPLFLHFDEGFMRDFLSSAIYVLVGSTFVVAVNIERLVRTRNCQAELVIAVPAAIATLGLALF